VRRALRLDARPGAIGRLAANVAWAAGTWLAAVQCWFLPRSLGAAAGPGHEGGDPWVLRAGRDLRLALRRFRREPTFATFAVATLAFGIGANVSVFGFVNRYVIGRLDLPAAAALVRVYRQPKSTAFDIMSYPTYLDARDGAPGLDLAAHIVTTVAFGPDEANDQENLELVSGNYFRVLRLAPVLGRLLDPSDDVTEGAHPVVVIGEGFWRARFGGRPDVVGQRVRLNGAPYEIVGVAPASFRGTQGTSVADLWAPLMMQHQLRPRSNSLMTRGWAWLRTIGRLQDGVSRAQAQGAIERVAADINRRFPSERDPLVLTVVPATTLEEPDRRALLPYVTLALALTALLLVVTCANLAGLMQARVIVRQREAAIRQSLGAGRARVLAEWLVECFVLAIAGGAGGLLVARVATTGLARLAPPSVLPDAAGIAAPVDWRVTAFALGVSLLAALLVGLPPARRAAALDISSLLKDDAGTTSGGRRGLRLRRAMVVVQVATSAVLLVASGLLVVSLHNQRTFDPGFRTANLAGTFVSLSPAGLKGPAAAVFTQQALEHVRAIPGVVAADVVVNEPLTQDRDAQGFRIPGYTAPDGSTIVSIDENVVGAAYFKTLGLTFVRGGPWSATSPAPEVVVNETMAARFWPGRDPVGEPIELVGERMLTVAGVVRDSTYYDVGEAPRPFVYLPAELARPASYAIMARTSVAPESLLADLGAAITATNPRVHPAELMTFEALRSAQLYPARLVAWSASAFGAIALGLTAVAIFGVVATSVAMRTREIGIRMVLGAKPAAVLTGVIRESAGLAAIGAAAGLAGAVGLAGLLRQWLFGVERFDPTVYAAVVALLMVMTLIAASLPARRAAKIDPIKALRA